MSLAFITAYRLATKYHPSGNGERCWVYTSFACRVDIVQNSCPGAGRRFLYRQKYTNRILQPIVRLTTGARTLASAAVSDHVTIFDG